MKKRCLIYLSVLGLLYLLSPNHAAAVTIFEDNFDGPGLDSSEWATPPSYYCGTNNIYCGISVSGGALSLYIPWIGPISDTRPLFPYVNTASNPFPAEEDWMLEWQMRYWDIGNKGDGFTLYGDAWGSPPIARVWQDSWTGTSLYLWEGNNPVKVWGTPAMLEWTSFSIESTQGEYRTYVNGEMVGSTANLLNPKFIQLGSSIGIEGSGSWNPVQFDYVRLDTLSDPPPPSQQTIPTPEPATALLLLSGLCMGRFFLIRTESQNK